MLPLVTIGASLLVLLAQLCYNVSTRRRADGYERIENAGDVSSSWRPADSAEDDFEDDGTHAAETWPAPRRTGSWHGSLRHAVSQTDEAVIEADRPRAEVAFVAFEALLGAAETAIHLLFLLATKDHTGRPSVGAIAGLTTWIYIFALILARLLFSLFHRGFFPRLWNHTASLYALQWLFTAVLFRSAIIHPRSKLAQRLTIADFVIASVLVMIALSTRKGNRCVLVEHDKGLEPSMEPLASLFSRATFSWVDPLVWRGYKKNIKLSDLWDLPAKDKAAAVLQDFRQLKYVPTG